MIPRTEKGAVEKLYRVRQYLFGQSYRQLTLDEMMGRNDAHDLIISIAQKFW